MIKITRILVPTDFSDFSRKALEYALALAETHGAEILLLHVVPPMTYAYEPGVVAANVSELDESVHRSCREKMDELQGTAVAGRVPCRTSIRDGAPFVEICRTAREEEMDLIVIATHGYTGLKHVLLGSTAEKVVRKAPCPVLTVKEKEHEFVMP